MRFLHCLLISIVDETPLIDEYCEQMRGCSLILSLSLTFVSGLWESVVFLFHSLFKFSDFSSLKLFISGLLFIVQSFGDQSRSNVTVIF